LLRTQGKNQLLVAATDLNVSLTAELQCRSQCSVAMKSRSMICDRDRRFEPHHLAI
jgi:hypothetical protein